MACPLAYISLGRGVMPKRLLMLTCGFRSRRVCRNWIGRPCELE